MNSKVSFFAKTKLKNNLTTHQSFRHFVLVLSNETHPIPKPGSPFFFSLYLHKKNTNT